MGDYNASIGSDNTDLENIMGVNGMGTITENGELFTEFCCDNNLIIGGSIFKHPDCHKYTWTHHNTKEGYQLDHICISKRWRRSLLDVRNKRSADIQSDHELVVAEIRLKIARVQRKTQSVARKFNVQKLKDQHIKDDFIQRLKSLDLLQNCDQNDINQSWTHIRDGIIKASEEVVGYLPPHRENWITEETWNMIERRKAVKNAQDQPGKILYKELCYACNKMLRKDYRMRIENLAQEAENAANLKDIKRLYDITRKLANNNNIPKQVPVKDKQGQLLTNTENQLKRWHEHFKETLNFECATDNQTSQEAPPFNEPSMSRGIRSDPPSKSEIRAAIKDMKSGKAAGIDRIAPEMLKADVNLFAELLFPIFRMAWEEQKLPDDWLQGVLIKLPKKGDLSNCNNWRGITLLSLPGKVLAKVILQRINARLENSIRKQQAGFRTGRSCIDQINTLRIIIEQMTEFNNPLHLVFVDYEKAFDRLSRESIWHALDQ
jgi:hypothetical protein